MANVPIFTDATGPQVQQTDTAAEDTSGILVQPTRQQIEFLTGDLPVDSGFGDINGDPIVTSARHQQLQSADTLLPADPEGDDERRRRQNDLIIPNVPAEDF